MHVLKRKLYSMMVCSKKDTYIDCNGRVLPPEEDDEGNVEHKIKITDINHNKFISLITQLKYRLTEGMGKAVYFIGITDNGHVAGTNKKLLQESVKNLMLMTNNIGNCKVRIKTFKTNYGEYIRAEIIYKQK